MRWISKFFRKKKKEGEDSKEEPVEDSFPAIPFDALASSRGLSAKREEEIIDDVANKIVQYGMEGIALMFLHPLKAWNSTIAQVGLLPYAPLLELIGLRGYDYVAFINKRENVERLIQKIEEDYI